MNALKSGYLLAINALPMNICSGSNFTFQTLSDLAREAFENAPEDSPDE